MSDTCTALTPSQGVHCVQHPLCAARPARRHQGVTGDITTEDIPDLLVATHPVLTNTGRLTAPPYHILHHLSDQLSVY